MKYWYIILSSLFFVSACKKEEDPDALRKVVVEAYLFEGQPVKYVRLKTMIPFGGKDTVADPINDADVRIIWNNVVYPLQPDGGDTGVYHFPGPQLIIQEGETYQLEVDYYEKTASASTSVPPPPVGLALDRDTLHSNPMAIFDSLLTGGEIVIQPPLIASWNNPNQDLYFGMIAITDTSPSEIPFSIGAFINAYIYSTPTDGSTYEVYDYQVTHYGEHQCLVFRINQEYADMYATLDQDSRTLNEPVSNVTNGLGVFSAFNSTSETFWVVP